jgi:hypothetical protein
VRCEGGVESITACNHGNRHPMTIPPSPGRTALLKALLREIKTDGDAFDEEKFPDLRSVDAKVREFRLLLDSLPGSAAKLRSEFDQDIDFQAQSRRVRLQALAHYCRTAISFAETGVLSQAKTALLRAPDVSAITRVLPELDLVIGERWLEAQRCQHAKAYFAAVVMMGSVLEGLLLARAHLSPADANRSVRAPKTRDGKNVPMQDWTLSALIDVAADCGWLKSDRGKFAHALRDSRNVVHPWHHVSTKAAFDEATCRMSWQVLTASVDDLLSSVAVGRP